MTNSIRKGIEYLNESIEKAREAYALLSYFEMVKPLKELRSEVNEVYIMREEDDKFLLHVKTTLEELIKKLEDK